MKTQRYTVKTQHVNNHPWYNSNPKITSYETFEVIAKDKEEAKAKVLKIIEDETPYTIFDYKIKSIIETAKEPENSTEAKEARVDRALERYQKEIDALEEHIYIVTATLKPTHPDYIYIPPYNGVELPQKSETRYVRAKSKEEAVQRFHITSYKIEPWNLFYYNQPTTERLNCLPFEDTYEKASMIISHQNSQYWKIERSESVKRYKNKLMAESKDELETLLWSYHLTEDIEDKNEDRITWS